ncbi:response regulator [Paraburkholderia sp. RP-4-7]|uniref:Response regulator n=1 Tax=Paraburkholderia polaris TaxID=2728848 RepID=A0A848IKU3_9BURK|nr:response regulator [Paraburkholderia polaris]NMM01900.1 response regulator [Paraburkholderia polaris]
MVISSICRKLLTADDDFNTTAMVALFFAAHNFEVQATSDGGVALRLFATWQPDAATLDSNMPGASGYEVARHMRRTGRSGGRTSLVAITGGVPPHEVAAKCHSAGFDLRVRKPADATALVEFVVLGIMN